MKSFLDLVRTQSRPLGFILIVQAWLVASTLMADSVLSNRISPEIILAPILASACSGGVIAMVTAFVVVVSVALKCQRYLPDFFAICALALPLVGILVTLEKQHSFKNSSSPLVKHLLMFLLSALMSFLSWFTLSMLAFGILWLFGAA